MQIQLHFRAYKLRHFLRGSGASETESDKSSQQRPPETAETDGTDAVSPAVPLSAVDRLSLNPERGILKNSSNSISRRSKDARDFKSSTTTAYESVGTVLADTKCEVDQENGGLDTANTQSPNELTESMTRTEVDLSCIDSLDVVSDVTSDVVETQTCQSQVLAMQQRSPSLVARGLRGSPVPNSIHDSCVN